MKLKTSLFKKGLIISDIKRFWWVSVLYALALFFVMPFNHYITIINNLNSNSSIDSTNRVKEHIANELAFSGGGSQVILLVVPVVIAALVFRFMQKNRQASLYHSLPLTRATLYFSNITSSVILFTIPVLFNTIIMLALNIFSSLSEFYTVPLIFAWLGYTMLFGIMFIAMSAFVGMFTGNSITQLAFVYILNFLPTYLSEFIRVNLRGLLYGFDTYSNYNLYDGMPMIRLFNMRSSKFLAVTIIVYIVVTIALLIGGLYAFKLRRPETAGDIITFKPVKPIFIYGFVVCVTLFGGAYFLELKNNSLSFLVLGYFLSSLIAYIVVQMLTNKSFKILHTYKGYLGFALVLAIFTIGVHFDVIGYINKIPDTSDVKEVYMSSDSYWIQHKDDVNFDKNRYYYTDTMIYKDPENIENITKLHKYLLDNRTNNGNQKYLVYQLNNGKKIVRKYSIDTLSQASVLSPIYESNEYKQNRFPILYQEAENIKYIEINDRRAGKNYPYIVSDKAQLDNFKVAIRKDIQALTYKDLAVLDNQEIVTINIVDTKEKNITYMLRSSYTNTFDWLKKEGIYDQIIVKSDDIESITIEYYNHNYSTEEPTKIPNSVEITDKAIIKELLVLSYNANFEGISGYSVILMGKGNQHYYNFSISFDDNISPALKSYLKKINPSIN